MLKSGHHDLSRLLLKDDDKNTLTDYETTLAAARSLVIDIKSGTNTPKHGSETRSKFALDDKKNFFLTASVYNGNVNIHLRHFIEQNGQSIPTKRGVVFNLGRWVRFESLIEEIGEFL